MKIYIVFTVISLFSFFFIRCDIGFEGQLASSCNIEESKKRNVFIASYCLPKNVYDSLNIKEAFVERTWRNGQNFEETVISLDTNSWQTYQFCIKIEDGMENIYYNKYALKVFDTERPGYVKESIICDIDSLSIKDTVLVDLLDKRTEWPFKKIGQLIFVKCEQKKVVSH